MKYKVSVIVPIFNVEKYIERCAQSLFEQTLDDIEYIFVDDASPDNSMAVLQTVIDRYPLRKDHVRIFRHETNKGLPQARRTGIMAATGEYIQHVDSDDYTDTSMLEKLYKKAVDEDADIVFFDFFYNKNSIVTQQNWDQWAITDFKEESITNLIWPNVWLRFTRASIFKQIPNEYYPKRNNAEDSVFSMLTAYYAQKIAYLQEPLYYYRINQESMTRSNSMKHRILNQYDRKENTAIMARFLKDNGIYEKYYLAIVRHKSWGRNKLLNMLPNFRAWWTWMTLYPELNWTMLFGNKHIHSGWKEKLWFAAIALGLYPRLKKHLLSKKYCPNIIWRSGCPCKK